MHLPALARNDLEKDQTETGLYGLYCTFHSDKILKLCVLGGKSCFGAFIYISKLLHSWLNKLVCLINEMVGVVNGEMVLTSFSMAVAAGKVTDNKDLDRILTILST